MDILICAKRTKIIATRTSSGLKIWQKCFGGPGCAPGPAGELAALPRLLDGFWEGKIGKEKEGKKCQKGRRWEEGQKGGGGE